MGRSLVACGLSVSLLGSFIVDGAWLSIAGDALLTPELGRFVLSSFSEIYVLCLIL